MNAELKNALIYAAKNAVNAILTNASLMALLPGAFNLHSAAGWWNIGKLTLSTVASREVMVWGPRLLKWSTTNGS